MARDGEDLSGLRTMNMMMHKLKSRSSEAMKLKTNSWINRIFKPELNLNQNTSVLTNVI